MEITIKNEGTIENSSWGAYDQHGNYLFDKTSLDDCYTEVLKLVEECEESILSCVINLLEGVLK